ncbi:MAG: hypothetical protein NWE94_01970 [Candidatus Bathyarchaeota archaeon]|nr:hypothetical protein [Candidatus Bathyarchaeota archaeon]
MLNKKQTTIAALAIMLVGLLVVNIAMAATPAAVSAQQPPADVEKLMPQIPKTIEEAETAVYPVRGRFLMWTHDGVHVIWGRYGNGIFVGTDNLGKRCWGIYGNGIFAGFYDGEFFWGKYQAGSWKAIGLFGLRYSYGRYVLFPSPVLTAAQP